MQLPIVTLLLLVFGESIYASPQPLRPTKTACKAKKHHQEDNVQVAQGVPSTTTTTRTTTIQALTIQTTVDLSSTATVLMPTLFPGTTFDGQSTVTVNPLVPLVDLTTTTRTTTIMSTMVGNTLTDTEPSSTQPTSLPKPSDPQPSSPKTSDPKPEASQTAGDNNRKAPTPNGEKHVFAHFMVGIVATYTAAAWQADINLAKSAGITGFALNTGKDKHHSKQLDFAYAAAEKIGGFELFISVDFNSGVFDKNSDHGAVAELLGRYVGRKAQFKMDGKPLVSTFVGDGFDWSKVETTLKTEVCAVPFYEPTTAADPNIQGLFSWSAWPGQLGNQPIRANMTTERDDFYLSELKKAGKEKMYMPSVSPWFYTHFGKDTYNKNWLFYSELLWKTRWEQILDMGDQVNFVEIVSWNDYGESHHIGPYDTPHTNDGSSKWNKGLDHSGMLDMAGPYIAAFRAGLKEPVITQDMVVYWYRPHLKSAECDASDNCHEKPKGADFVDDSVFVTVLSKGGGTVTITSGSNAPSIHQVPAGSHAFAVPMGVGKQSFKWEATSGGTKEATSKVDISDQCLNGIYNFNFHSGSIKL